MITDDFWTSKGPTPTELRAVDRLSRHRRALEEMTPTDEAEALVKTRAIDLLEDMEECLCEEGSGARFLAEGWRQLERFELCLTQLRSAPEDLDAGVVLIDEHRPSRPPTEGGTHWITTSIDTLRSVARHAADDPELPDPGTGGARPFLPGLLPRITRFVAGFLADGTPSGSVLRVIARALSGLLPLLERAPREAMPLPEPTEKDGARIQLLQQERAARARERAAAKEEVAGRTRPDVPTSVRIPADVAAALFGPADDAWNDLLDLVSEALEVFIVAGDRGGVSAVLEILDLTAEAFGLDLAEAA